MDRQDVSRPARPRALSASLALVIAALIVVAVGMHGLVQAQRLAESGDGGASLTGQMDPTTQLSVVTPTWTITLTASPFQIHVSGETSLLEAQVTGPFLSPIPDGTEVLFETSLGAVGSSAITKTTVAGVASATLTSGPVAGTAHITATAGDAHAYTSVDFLWHEILLPMIARNLQ